MNKIATIAPGMRATQQRLVQLSTEVDRAVRAADVHDRFLMAAEKSSEIQVMIQGPRGGNGAVFSTNVPAEFEEIFSIVMRMLNARVSEQYDKVKRLKEEL